MFPLNILYTRPQLLVLPRENSVSIRLNESFNIWLRRSSPPFLFNVRNQNFNSWRSYEPISTVKQGIRDKTTGFWVTGKILQRKLNTFYLPRRERSVPSASCQQSVQVQHQLVTLQEQMLMPSMRAGVGYLNSDFNHAYLFMTS